ncbi:hypothetical protein D3C77_499320 [compost metagenome]
MRTAVECRLQQRCAEAWHQWQYGHRGGLPGLAIVECGGQLRRLRCAGIALEGDEGVASEAAHLGRAQGIEQFTVKVQLHAVGLALTQGVQRACQVVPGIAVGNAGRQHRPGKQHRCLQTPQLIRHGGSAVGQGIGAMQNQHAIAALMINGVDDRFAQALPVRGGHVGAVDQRQQFAKLPVGDVGHAGQALAHPLLEARGRGQAVGAGLHANGAAGVQHHDVLGRVCSGHGAVSVVGEWGAGLPRDAI